MLTISVNLFRSLSNRFFTFFIHWHCMPKTRLFLKASASMMHWEWKDNDLGEHQSIKDATNLRMTKADWCVWNY